jgi:DNA replication protein DnaD
MKLRDYRRWLERGFATVAEADRRELARHEGETPSKDDEITAACERLFALGVR